MPSTSTHKRKAQARWVRLASYASVLTSLTLVAIKYVAWSNSASVSVLASLLDSTLDVIASLFIAIAVVISQRPPDKKYRFGHGKAEPLAALAQSIFIAGSASYVMMYSIRRLWQPQAINDAEHTLLYMAVSFCLVFCLIVFQRFVILKTGSTAIRSDSLNYLGDLGTNALVLIGLWFSHTPWLDPLLGLCIALFILASACKIAFDSVNQLLDRELPQSFRKKIQHIVLTTEGVEGLNDLRSYRSGPNRFVQFHLELDDAIPLKEAHRITENVSTKLKRFDPSLDVMIHQEPISLSDDPDHHHWGKE